MTENGQPLAPLSHFAQWCCEGPRITIEHRMMLEHHSSALVKAGPASCRLAHTFGSDTALVKALQEDDGRDSVLEVSSGASKRRLTGASN